MGVLIYALSCTTNTPLFISPLNGERAIDELYGNIIAHLSDFWKLMVDEKWIKNSPRAD